jgi:hypothetical protein
MDRIIRVIVGLIMVIVGFVAIGDTAGIVVGAIGAIILITGITGFCLIYALLHYNTHGVR